MADNVQLSIGTADGAIIATDQDASAPNAHYQISKQVFGALNTFVLATANSGTVDAGTQRVVLATDVALPTGSNAIGKLAANSGVTIGAVEIAAAQTLATVTTVATVTNLAQMNGAAITMGNGASGTGVQRVTIANDSTGIIALTTGSAQIGHLEANQSVNVAQINGVTPLMGNGASGTGAQRVTLANDSTGVIATVTTVTTVSTVTNLSQLGGVAIAMNTGVRSTGTQRVTIATDDVVPASQSGTWTVQPGNTANTTAWLVQGTPATSGGYTVAMFSGSDGSSILVATAQVVKASAGQLYGYYAYNPEAAVTFVHFYNVAAASVTVGTTNPLFTLAIPGGAAANLFTDTGIPFSNAGWSVAATTTAGGNTAPATGVSLVAWYK